MKSISVRDLQKKLKECLDTAQEERVVITRHGRPAALLVGIEGEDWETVVLQSDANFWKLIEERRKQPSVSLEDFKKSLEEDAPAEQPPKRRRQTTSRRQRAAR